MSPPERRLGSPAFSRLDDGGINHGTPSLAHSHLPPGSPEPTPGRAIRGWSSQYDDRRRSFGNRQREPHVRCWRIHPAARSLPPHSRTLEMLGKQPAPSSSADRRRSSTTPAPVPHARTRQGLLEDARHEPTRARVIRTGQQPHVEADCRDVSHHHKPVGDWSPLVSQCLADRHQGGNDTDDECEPRKGRGTLRPGAERAHDRNVHGRCQE
jgi:hypothetical protein